MPARTASALLVAIIEAQSPCDAVGVLPLCCLVCPPLLTIVLRVDADMTSFDPKSFIREVSARREVSAIRQLGPFLSIPGMVSLGAGNPNSDKFPIKDVTLGLKDGTSIEWSKEEIAQALQVRAHYPIAAASSKAESCSPDISTARRPAWRRWCRCCSTSRTSYTCRCANARPTGVRFRFPCHPVAWFQRELLFAVGSGSDAVCAAATARACPQTLW